MDMQKYELMVIYKPILFEDIKTNTISKIEKELKKLGGEMKEVENLGKKLFSYPIKTFKEGHYIQYDLKISPENLDKFKADLSLYSDVLRFLIVKK